MTAKPKPKPKPTILRLTHAEVQAFKRQSKLRRNSAVRTNY